MTKAERLEFMRRKFKTGNRYPSATKPRAEPQRQIFWHSAAITIGQRVKELPVGWVYASNPKRAPHVAVSRKDRPSPLTRIADIWAKEIPVTVRRPRF